MLGLRHYLGTAIDLFQGDITEFVCDAMGIDASLADNIEKKIAAAWQGRAPSPQPQLLHMNPPLWQGGGHNEATDLLAIYRQSFNQAAELKFLHLALAPIASDAAAFPLHQAAAMAMTASKEFCQQHRGKLRRISFVLAQTEVYQAYQTALYASFPESEGN